MVQSTHPTSSCTVLVVGTKDRKEKKIANGVSSIDTLKDHSGRAIDGD